MVAAALMRCRPFRAAIRWIAGSPPPLDLEAEIRRDAQRLEARGYQPIPALAGAESVWMGRTNGLRWDGVHYDEDAYTWWGVYETANPDVPYLRLPLARATEATQRGIGSLN